MPNTILEKNIPSYRPKGEIEFKMAIMELFLKGIYPSSRQIMHLIRPGKYPGWKKINLNGKQCLWKNQMFGVLGIESYMGYTKRGEVRERWEQYRDDDRKAYKIRWVRTPQGNLTYVGEGWFMQGP